MPRYLRLNLLLFISFTIVFMTFVNHDLIGQSETTIIIKQKATFAQIMLDSVVVSLVISILTTLAHAAGEVLVKRYSRSSIKS